MTLSYILIVQNTLKIKILNSIINIIIKLNLNCYWFMLNEIIR